MINSTVNYISQTRISHLYLPQNSNHPKLRTYLCPTTPHYCSDLNHSDIIVYIYTGDHMLLVSITPYGTICTVSWLHVTVVVVRSAWSGGTCEQLLSLGFL